VQGVNVEAGLRGRTNLARSRSKDNDALSALGRGLKGRRGNACMSRSKQLQMNER
jgi:hypothetical protein